MALTPAEEKLAKIAPISEQAVEGFDKALELSDKGNLESEQVTKEENKVQDEQHEQQQKVEVKPKLVGVEKTPEEQKDEGEQQQEQQQVEQQQEEKKEDVAAPDSAKVLADKFDKLIETLTPKAQPKQEVKPKAPEFKLFEIDDQLMEQVLEGGQVGKAALTKAIQIAAVQGAQMAIQVVTDGFANQIAPLQQVHAEQRVKAAETRYVELYPADKEMLDLGRQVAFRMLQTDASWAQKPQDEFFKAVHDQVDTIVQLVKKNGGEVKVEGNGGQQKEEKAQGRTTPPKIGGGGARGAGAPGSGAKLTPEQDMMREMQSFQPRQGRS